MQVQVLDRVVNTRKGFSVPFGLKGTVTAITESPTKNERDTMYDVVFDRTFKDGMELNCSPGRGYRLPRTAFIDISYGKRIYEQKTGKEGALMGMAERTENPWQNTNGQKFFNQFMNAATQRQIPDQYNYYQQKPQEPAQSSAFVPFTNNKPRGILNSSETDVVSPSKEKIIPKRSEFRQDVEKDKESDHRPSPKKVFLYYSRVVTFKDSLFFFLGIKKGPARHETYCEYKLP